MPGEQPDGTNDEDTLVRFIEETRKFCQNEGMLEVCDSTLGQIFAHAPADSDGVWPCKPVCDILNRPEMDGLRRGFLFGVRNKRGTFSKAFDEGGEQERKLAEKYRGYARALENSHVYVADALEEIADRQAQLTAELAGLTEERMQLMEEEQLLQPLVKEDVHAEDDSGSAARSGDLSEDSEGAGRGRSGGVRGEGARREHYKPRRRTARDTESEGS